MKSAKLENEYAYIKDGKVFLKGYLNMPDRQIGEVKNTEEEAFQYFVNRYDIAVSKVETLEKEIDEAMNKGSYLTKLLQLKKRLMSFDGIGDFIPLIERLEVKESGLNELIDENQKNNLLIKDGLLAEARRFEKSENWQEASDRLQDIRTRWIRTGPVHKEIDQKKEDDFKAILDNFYQRRKVFYDEENRIIDERKAKYEALIQASHSLHSRKDWDEAFEDLKQLQIDWKEVGEIPAKMMKHLYKFFKKSNTSFYEKYCRAKGITVKRKVDPRVEAQYNMMKEAERLTQVENEEIFDATNKAKVLLNDWKNVRVPSHLADRNVAERFRAACDKIFELSYLMKVVTRRNPSFSFMDNEEKDIVKYREMDNIVKRARVDMEQLEVTTSQSRSSDEEMDRMVFNNLKTQKRKLLMKEIILEELRRKVGM